MFVWYEWHILTHMDEKCHLPYQSTKDAVVIKTAAIAASPAVHPGGIQSGEKQDMGPR